MSRIIKAEDSSEINLCKTMPHIADDEQDCGHDEEAFSPFCQIFGVDAAGAGALPASSDAGVTAQGQAHGVAAGEAGVTEGSVAVNPAQEAVRDKGKAILDEARKKAADIETNAYNQGYAQGQKDGEEFGRRQYEARCARLKGVIESIQTQGEAILGRYEQQLVRLCMDVSRCVVQREIDVSPETIILSIKEGLKQAVEGSRMDIRLNPRDAELAQDFVKNEIRIPGGHPVNIISDNQIGQGGCLIETDFGLIDATIDGRWQAVADAIKKVLDERSRGHAD